MHFGNQFYFGVLRADFGMQGLVDEDHWPLTYINIREDISSLSNDTRLNQKLFVLHS